MDYYDDPKDASQEEFLQVRLIGIDRMIAQLIPQPWDERRAVEAEILIKERARLVKDLCALNLRKTRRPPRFTPPRFTAPPFPMEGEFLTFVELKEAMEKAQQKPVSPPPAPPQSDTPIGGVLSGVFPPLGRREEKVRALAEQPAVPASVVPDPYTPKRRRFYKDE